MNCRACGRELTRPLDVAEELCGVGASGPCCVGRFLVFADRVFWRVARLSNGTETKVIDWSAPEMQVTFDAWAETGFAAVMP